MESTGQPGRIHASQTTAEQLIAAGKGEWLRAREEAVFAKGKGNMKTYWICPNDDSQTIVTVSESSLTHGSTLPGPACKDSDDNYNGIPTEEWVWGSFRRNRPLQNSSLPGYGFLQLCLPMLWPAISSVFASAFKIKTYVPNKRSTQLSFAEWIVCVVYYCFSTAWLICDLKLYFTSCFYSESSRYFNQSKQLIRTIGSAKENMQSLYQNRLIQLSNTLQFCFSSHPPMVLVQLGDTCTKYNHIVS